MKIKKLLLYIFSSLFVLLIIAFSVGYFFLDDLVDSRLKKLISKKFGTFYQLSYDSVEKDINFSDITFIVNKASFSSDTTDLEGMEKFPTYFFTTELLKVEKISTWDVLLGASLNIENITLEKPTFTLYTQEKTKNTDVKNKRGKSILASASIHRFLLEKGEVTFIDFATKKKTFESKSIIIDINDFKLDMTDMTDYRTFLSFESFSVESSSPNFEPQSGFYNYSMESMKIDSKENILSFKGVQIDTKTSLRETSKSVVNHKEVLNTKIGQLNITDVDLKKIIFENKIEIGKIDIENSYLHLFKNNTKKLESGFHKRVLNEMIRSIKAPIKIDTIQIFNLDYDFELLNPAHSQPAIMNVKVHDGYIANFNTDRNSQDTVRIFLEGKFMNRGDIWLTVDLVPSDSIKNYQRFAGAIKNMPFNILNPLIRQFSNAKIASGYINEVSFHGVASANSSYGSVVFRYNDLKFDFYKKKGEHKRFGILSGVANLSTHKNNPDKHGKLIAAKFHYVKKPWQGSLGLWLGGILNGMFNVAVKELPKEIIEEEQEFKKTKKLHLLHHDKGKKEEKDKKEKKKRKKHPLFHLKDREKKNHDGLHIFHKKNKEKSSDEEESPPKEKKSLFHHKKKKN